MPYEYRDFSCNFVTNGFKGSKQLTTTEKAMTHSNERVATNIP